MDDRSQEILLGVPIMLALGLACWVLLRDTLRTREQPMRRHMWVITGALVGLEVVIGWYWVGLFCPNL